MKTGLIISSLFIVVASLSAYAEVARFPAKLSDGTGDGAGPGAPIFLYQCTDLTKNVSLTVSKAWPDYQKVEMSLWTEVPLTFINDKNVSLIPGKVPGEPLTVKGDRFELTISLSPTKTRAGELVVEAELTDSLRKELWYPPQTLALDCVVLSFKR